MRRVWIDLDNSPHVPFFAPIIRELALRNHEVVLTARDCFQVCGLADLHRFKYKRIGKHYGKKLLFKRKGAFFWLFFFRNCLFLSRKNFFLRKHILFFFLNCLLDKIKSKSGWLYNFQFYIRKNSKHHSKEKKVQEQCCKKRFNQGTVI